MSLRSSLAPALLANRYPPLHGLRVLAIVSVAQVHVSVVLAIQGLLTHKTLYVASVMIWFGLDMFFLLSGFLIGSMLLHEGRRGGVGRFYLRRAFRTFPLYYTVLVALSLLWPRPHATASTFLQELLYVQNYTSQHEAITMPWAWSLCVEEHFYLFIPLLMAGLKWLADHRRRLATFALLFALGLSLRVFEYAGATTPWTDDLLFKRIFMRTHLRLDILVAGIALAYVQHHFGDALRAFYARARNRALSYAVALACLAWLSMPLVARPGHAWTLLSWGTVTSVLYCALIPPLINYESAASRLLGTRPCVWFATLGYGIYLVHIPVCEHFVAPIARVLLRGHQWSIGVVWPLSLALLLAGSFTIAYVLHVTVEKPALWLREKIAP